MKIKKCKIFSFLLIIPVKKYELGVDNNYNSIVAIMILIKRKQKAQIKRKQKAQIKRKQKAQIKRTQREEMK